MHSFIMISCHPEDHCADLYLSHPTLIIEILSDNTEALDRGVKFASYRLLESLQEYVMVDIGARRIENYRSTEDNGWLLHETRNADNCVFKSLGVTLPISEIFEDVTP
jgi:Uma2 family endonuclease